MFLEYGVLDEGFVVVWQDVGVDHVVQGQFTNVVQICGRHVQTKSAYKRKCTNGQVSKNWRVLS